MTRSDLDIADSRDVLLGKIRRGQTGQRTAIFVQLQNRAQSLQDELGKLQNAPAGTPIDQRTVQAKADQLDQLKKEIQRKGEDAQTAYNRRRNEIFAPLQQEVGNALEAFAKARNINVIIDGTQVPLLYAADSIDITAAFIADFNAKNPATAAATPPK